jgi:hypothetical protein
VTVALGLGLAWGLLAGLPVARRARRAALLTRLSVLPPARSAPAFPPAGSPAGPARRARWARWARWARPVARVASGLRARRRDGRRGARLVAEVPAALDLLQVALGAGASPRRAVEVAARWAPPGVAAALGGVLDAVRLGDALATALARLGATTPPLAPLTDVLVASEELGSPAGPGLARVARDVRAELRRRAEARARVLPVQLLFPLVFLVLPAFGLLTVVPALLSALAHL